MSQITFGNGHIPNNELLKVRSSDSATHTDHTVVFTNPSFVSSLKTGEAALFTVYALLHGRTHRKTLCKIESDDHCPKGYIALNSATRHNLNVREGHEVRVNLLENVPDIEKICIVPLNDSHHSFNRNFKEQLLVPYFDCGSRLVHKDDIFNVTEDNDADVLVKAVIVPGHKSECYGRVTRSTTIKLEQPVARPDGGIGYDDIGGLRHQLPQIREVIELTLKYPELFTKYGVKKPKGILLYGPPGTGKTHIARALSNEVGAFFFSLTGPEIVASLAGETEGNLRKAFEECNKHSKAILFIDEIDSIAPKRDKAQGELEKRIVAQLLTLMDGVTSGRNLIVIAATNRPNAIDPALRRPGRFDKEISIGIPDEEDRLEILHVHTRRMKVAPDVELKQIARDTHGYVGADLAALCCEAALQQVRKVAQKRLSDGDKRLKDEVLPPVKMENFLHALAATNPSGLREMAIETPNVSWDDIGGLEQVKNELKETILYPILYPEDYADFGINASRGVLMYGPPGCGKTLMAKAVAKQCGANFISVKGPELLTMWFGESEANVRDLFEKARAAAPCIIFFDEIDSIAKARGSSDGGAGAASDRVINQLLTEMDGIGVKKSIFIIGATNCPDVIDKALMRPGRLDQLIYIPLPDEKNRLDILNASLKRCKVARNVPLEQIARKTVGFSGADLAEICQRACKLAIRDRILSRTDFEKEQKRKRDEGAIFNEEYTKTEPELTRKHFLAAMEVAHKSVSDDDVRVYELFSQKLNKKSEAMTNFTFEDEPSQTNAADNSSDEDDDEDMCG